MNFKNSSYFTIILSFFILLFQFSSAQLVVNDSISANDLADLLIGDGVNISNVVLNCPQGAYGTFDASQSNIGMNEGVMLSSGSLTNAIGPNNLPDVSLDNLFPGDAALTGLAGIATFDACILEFDITPERDTLKFEFVFGSDEYLEFVNAGYNDVFAFFISGPGITGTQNIALIPGTTTPVAIDNVNNLLNQQYFVDNGDGNTGPQFTDPTVVQYDGFTIVLTAIIPLIPGQTYHLRLAIADAGDEIYDSGVFIAQISSTGCPTVQVLETTHITPNTARLTWSPIGVADHYQIRGWPVGSTNFSYLNIPAGSPNFRNVAGLVNNTCYAWQILTFCDPGGNEVSSWSAIDTFCTECTQPDSTWTNPVVANGAQLNWSPVPGSAAYEIKGKRIGSSQWTTILVGGSQSLLQAFGLTPSTSYHWTVRAWCDTGGVRVSSWTPLITFTTTSVSRMEKPDEAFVNFEKSELPDFTFYPNPAFSGEEINFQISHGSKGMMTIFDVSGKKVKMIELKESENHLLLKGFQPGLYFCEFSSQHARTLTRKLLIR